MDVSSIVCHCCVVDGSNLLISYLLKISVFNFTPFFTNYLFIFISMRAYFSSIVYFSQEYISMAMMRFMLAIVSLNNTICYRHHHRRHHFIMNKISDGISCNPVPSILSALCISISNTPQLYIHSYGVIYC